MGKTYEILCKRGHNRVECSFKKQDSDLCCAECSFSLFKIRQKEKEKSNGQQQPDIQQ